MPTKFVFLLTESYVLFRLILGLINTNGNKNTATKISKEITVGIILEHFKLLHE